MNDTPITGESLFESFPEKFVPLELDFVALDQSIIWKLNDFFWSYSKLWLDTYGEHYEHSLPAGVSESHRPEFIEASARRFFDLLTKLYQVERLPPKIIVLEQGPGTGLYARGFLDHIKKWSGSTLPYYQKLTYILSDTSTELLQITTNQLYDHQGHITIYKQSSMYDVPQEYQGHVLFVRHGNLWDQLPCRLFQILPAKVSEIYVRAVLDTAIQKQLKLLVNAPSLKKLNHSQKSRTFLDTIKSHPKIWKPMMRSLKLETKIRLLSEKDQVIIPHLTSLLRLAKRHQFSGNITLSNGALEQLTKTVPLIDWKHQGYLEIIDIVVRTIDGFEKDRRPKKYDGALAVPVNGPLLKAAALHLRKHASFTQIHGLNTLVTIREHDLQTLLESKHFVTFGEIAAKRNQTVTQLEDSTQTLFDLGVDVVVFSDQAHAGEQFLSLNELVDLDIFRKFNGRAILPILAARRKTPTQIEEISTKLKQQGITNLFVVSGDPRPDEKGQTTSTLTALLVIKKLAKDYFMGAVAHPDPTDIPNLKQKLARGGKFFIIQACYDRDLWNSWLNQIIKEKIHQQVSLVPAIIPIVSRKTISMLDLLPDVTVSEEIKNALFQLPDNQAIKAYGIELARKMIEDYKKSDIFAGVYIYTKSASVVHELLTY